MLFLVLNLKVSFPHWGANKNSMNQFFELGFSEIPPVFNTVEASWIQVAA
jgi:hypothetical protein